MAKKKRSRTSGFSLGSNKPTGALPSKDEINKTIAKVAQHEVKEDKIKRIPFTTALTPKNRALLETASHQQQEAVADILNRIVVRHFEEVAPVRNEEMLQIFLKIYESKVK